MSFARLFGTSAAIGERLSVLVHTFATVSNLGVHFAVHHSAGRRTPTGNVVQYHSGSRQYRTGLAVRLPVELGRNAAAATTISLAIGGIISLGYLLFHARHLRPVMPKWSRKSLRLSLRNIGYQCHIGSSALLGKARWPC